MMLMMMIIVADQSKNNDDIKYNNRTRLKGGDNCGYTDDLNSWN